MNLNATISYSIPSLVTGMQSSPVLVAHGSQTKPVNITDNSGFDKCQVSLIVPTFIQQVTDRIAPLSTASASK
ncbi:hypothetical protein AZE42_01382 [Rhizopogon vesiculosus]|uniref:Uncharacterized protein n=1 Tax=Rhizopogon vesiculosus TaxID=180088 RepID=A0A1J8PPB4_9AGAM|nr:hypothetical protein AZE42_01382 [Rhizopogon vesiculosus]